MGHKKIPFDDLFVHHIGELGCYQILVFLLVGVCAFSGVEPIYTNFIAISEPHICHVTQVNNLTFAKQEYIISPGTQNAEGLTAYSQCSMYNFNYSQFTEDDFEHWNRTAMLEQYKPQVIPCSGYTFDESDFKGSIVEKWLLVCDKKWLVDLVSTITIAGCFLGAFLGGAIADRYGRRKGLLVCCLVKVVGNVAAIFSPNYIVFSVARFAVGYGSTSVYLIAFVLLVELVGPSYRNTAGMGFSILYSLGFMAIPLAAYLTKDSMMFQIAITSPMLIMGLYICLIPESPRWLLLHNKTEEAFKVVSRIASINRRPLSPDFDITNVVTSTSSRAKSIPNATCIDLLATPVIRLRSLILFLDWFTVSLIFYALSLNAGNLVGNIYLNTFLLGVVEIPANLITMWSLNVKMIGRRWTHVVTFLIAGLSCLACVPIIETGKVLWLSTVFAMIGKAGSTAAFNGLYLYTSELYPTQIRNLGMGACSAMARVSGMTASYAGDSLQEVWRPLPSLLFGGLGTLSALATIKLPETLKTTLLETVIQVEEPTARYRGNVQDGDGEEEPLLGDVYS